jgi:site-specific recombinase XerC
MDEAVVRARPEP